MTLKKEKKLLPIPTDFFFPHCNLCKGKDGNQNAKAKKKKNEDSLRLEHKIYVLYSYVYENNFPKDFHLN